jgi:3-keto-L-gulonate-6-phosphate decarboxylase
MRIGKEVNKKDLESLHKAGVDLMIVGRFLGKAKNRRVELEVISTFDGKKVIDIKRDRIGL